MNSDSEEEAELPEEIGYAASDGDFERVKAWLEGGSASDPRSVNAVDDTGWTLLMCTAMSDLTTPEHVEFMRYLISRGARLDAQSRERRFTALHFACKYHLKADAGLSTPLLVSALVAEGANVNQQTRAGATPLFMIEGASESMLDVVTILLRAGASLDIRLTAEGDEEFGTSRQGLLWSFEEHLNEIEDPYAEHVGAVRDLVASLRAAGSWKAHCRLAHKQILRLRSLVARGRVKLPSRTRRRSPPRGRDARQKRALEFVVRQGDNGIVWHILSFWRATA